MKMVVGRGVGVWVCRQRQNSMLACLLQDALHCILLYPKIPDQKLEFAVVADPNFPSAERVGTAFSTRDKLPPSQSTLKPLQPRLHIPVPAPLCLCLLGGLVLWCLVLSGEGVLLKKEITRNLPLRARKGAKYPSLT